MGHGPKKTAARAAYEVVACAGAICASVHTLYLHARDPWQIVWFAPVYIMLFSWMIWVELANPRKANEKLD